MKYEIKRSSNGRCWDVYRDGALLEGGFFTYEAAYECRDEYLLQDQLEEFKKEGKSPSDTGPH
jgi:hypothetical protein